MDKDPTSALRHGLRLGRWDEYELWIAVFGAGSNLTAFAVERIVAGGRSTTVREYAVLRLVLNERLDDLGLDHPLPAWQELPDLAA